MIYSIKFGLFYSIGKNVNFEFAINLNFAFAFFNFLFNSRQNKCNFITHMSFIFVENLKMI